MAFERYFFDFQSLWLLGMIMAEHSSNAIGGKNLISDKGLLKNMFCYDYTLCLSPGNCFGSLNCSGSLTTRGQELVPGTSRASVGETKNSTKVDHGPVGKTC